MVQLIVENAFAETVSNSKELQLTVFDRVFAKLINEGRSIGKVQPMYLISNNLAKTLGIVTLNKGGSYSFFPELPSDHPFDHMTFAKDLEKDKHHYTGVSNSGREKVLPINAESLTNGMYHVATFVYKDHHLLKGIPKEVIYPEVEVNKLNELKEAFITSDRAEGSAIIKLANDEGVFCMQFFLIPKNVDYKTMRPFVDPFKKVQQDFEFEGDTFLCHVVIPHQTRMIIF
jgi:hypothetical protein